jgi:DNA-binding NtrC family response regulator
VFHILVADDEVALLELLTLALTGPETEVEGVTTGLDAIKKYEESHYDIVITDIQMPGITGIELIRRLKEFNRITEFIIVTGYASMDTALEAVKLGASDYVVKPFRIDELNVSVNNAKEKVVLKRMNKELLERLENFHQEIERYRAIRD